MKRCSKCSFVRSKGEFAKGHDIGGLSHWCKLCHREYRNRPDVHARRIVDGTNYRAQPDNRLARASYDVDRRASTEGRLYLNRKNAKYNVSPKGRAATARYRASERFVPVRIAADLRRRARKASAPGKNATARQVADLFKSYHDICVYCPLWGSDNATAMTIDHIVPLASRGSNDILNLVPSCGLCNSSKGAKSLLVWLFDRSAALKEKGYS